MTKEQKSIEEKPELTIEEQKKLARMQKFGIVEAEDKKSKRQERFGLPVPFLYRYKIKKTKKNKTE